MLDKLKKMVVGPSKNNEFTGYRQHTLSSGKVNLIYSNRGKGNKLYYKTSANLHNININCHGNNNVILIGEQTKVRDVSINIRGHNNIVKIGSECEIKGKLSCKGNSQSIEIGNRTVFKDVYILCIENTHVKIGTDCLFSYDIDIRTSDAHSVIDVTTNRRTNHAQDIVIGNKVWMAAGVLVSKGAIIPDNTIVGARAIINKPFTESGTILAGIPAKIVKTGITWSRDRLKLDEYGDDEEE